MQLIDGKAISELVKQEIAAEVAGIVAKGGKRPHLAAILVGHDGGSETYVAAKVKACEVCGFKSSLIRYEADVTEEELLAKVRELNEDADVDGFIVQLPLPKHISEQKVIETIDYRKDVDGFHPINVGRMSIGLPCYVSATPNGILELLKRYHIETQGKKCVVLGRSNIVGKPMASLMMQKAYPGDATVTVCHSRSKDLVKECQEADIIIAALGQPNFVKAEMVKEGAVVIDVALLPIRGKILNVQKASLSQMLNNKECAAIIQVVGAGSGAGFDIEQSRYHKVIMMTDADVDGAHIRILLLTLFYRYMRPLIEHGYVYAAVPPLHRIALAGSHKGEFIYTYSDDELAGRLADLERRHISYNPDIQRYKGLGEMDADQLADTTMDPRTRMLRRIRMEDAAQASEIFSLLMGDDVPPRKAFIVDNADDFDRSKIDT